jgi:hypothetical protein
MFTGSGARLRLGGLFQIFLLIVHDCGARRFPGQWFRARPIEQPEKQEAGRAGGDQSRLLLLTVQGT